MTGSFSGLNTALSAIRYQQAALDVANNNVANVNTDGYVRRRALGSSVGGPDQPVMYAASESAGNGVRAESIQRIYDALVDARVRRANGSLSYLTTQQAILRRIETAINEPGPNGVGQALSDLNDALQDLVSDPGGKAARATVLAKADALAAAIRTQSGNVTQEVDDQRAHAATTVQQLNGDAGQLAQLNHDIYLAEKNGSDVGTLYDQRDRVALSLAKEVGGVVTVAPDGRYNVDVPIAGGTPASIPLVTGDTAATMTITGGVSSGPLSYAIGGTAVTGGLSGELGGLTETVTTALTSYKAGLDALARQIADAFNAQNAAGTDQDGITGGALFTYDPADPAGTIGAITDPRKIAASSTAQQTPAAPDLDGSNADALSRVVSGSGIAAAYTTLVTTFGASVQAVNTRTATQAALTAQVTDEREQLAGVNLDEETVNLVAAQHAYEAAAKVMQTLDSILDTLINMKR